MLILIKKISKYFNKTNKISNSNSDNNYENNYYENNYYENNYYENNYYGNNYYRNNNSGNNNSGNNNFENNNSENNNSENNNSNSGNNNSNSENNNSDNSDSKTNDNKSEIDYIKYKNICPKIAELFNLTYDSDKFNKYDINIPNEYGLLNSEKIIPEYYLSRLEVGKIFEIDFTFTIIDSIRNIRILTYYQKEHLKTLEKNELYEIILEYDKSMNAINNMINNVN